MRQENAWVQCESKLALAERRGRRDPVRGEHVQSQHDILVDSFLAIEAKSGCYTAVALRMCQKRAPAFVRAQRVRYVAIHAPCPARQPVSAVVAAARRAGAKSRARAAAGTPNHLRSCAPLGTLPGASSTATQHGYSGLYVARFACRLLCYSGGAQLGLVVQEASRRSRLYVFSGFACGKSSQPRLGQPLFAWVAFDTSPHSSVTSYRLF